MDYLREVATQVADWDFDRPRSRQVALGWSNMADCRAYMGFRVRGDWATDDEDVWGAVSGTWDHEQLTQLRADATLAIRQNGRRIAWDVPTEYRGVPGRADEVDFDECVVTDWKFPKLSSARVFDDPDVLEAKMVQPNGYAAGLADSLTAKPITVRLLVMPRDGKFDDWRCYEQPFDREAADAAIARYALVKVSVDAGEPLPKDKPWAFCEGYCEFFTACRGGRRESDDLEITDPVLAAAVERYGQAVEQAGQADKLKDELAPLIRGLRGHARGFKVSMTRPGRDKFVDDPEAMVDYLSAHGADVPKMLQPGAPAKLNVRRIKR